jgi:hypothetical protein
MEERFYLAQFQRFQSILGGRVWYSSSHPGEKEGERERERGERREIKDQI